MSGYKKAAWFSLCTAATLLCRSGIVIAISLLLLLQSASAGDGDSDSKASRTLEAEILRLTNIEREKRGLSPVRPRIELSELARMQSENMSKYTFFSHTDHLGRSPGDRKEHFFPQVFGGVGENIAYIGGATGTDLAKRFVEVWMDSPGHRENILRREFSHLGVGVYRDRNLTYATQIFGDLVAVCIDRIAPSYPYGSEQTFRFRFIGKFNRSKISIYVHFPDENARFYTEDGYFYTGAGTYKPQWHGDEFTIRIKLDKGRGKYIVNMGSFGSFSPGDFAIVAE